MGHIPTRNGLKVSDKKVKAKMRSFLGLTKFCAKFVPHFTSVTAPLWHLTSQDDDWKWEDEQYAFDKLKKRD